MADPVVKLKFEGDPSDAVAAMDKVSSSADGMSGKIRSSGESFDRAGQGIDDTGEKAGDLESGLRGITDSAAGFAQIAQGDVMAGLTDLAGGAEALAFGLRGVVVPALKQVATRLAATRVGMMAQAAAARVARVATLAWAGAQRVLNAVMRMSPLAKVALAIGLVTAAVVWLWNRSEGVRRVIGRVWNWIWGKIRTVGKWIGGVVGGLWDGLTSGIEAAWRVISGIFDRISNAVGWVKRQIESLSGNLAGEAAAGLSDAQKRKLGLMHTGGIVPGSPGQEVPMMLEAGEEVTRAGARGQGGQTATLRAGDDFGELILATIRKAVRSQGGDVRVVLGRG